MVRRHEVYPALPGPPLRLSVDPELFPRLPNLRLLAATMLKAEAALSQSDGCLVAGIVGVRGISYKWRIDGAAAAAAV